MSLLGNYKVKIGKNVEGMKFEFVSFCPKLNEESTEVNEIMFLLKFVQIC